MIDERDPDDAVLPREGDEKEPAPSPEPAPEPTPDPAPEPAPEQ